MGHSFIFIFSLLISLKFSLSFGGDGSDRPDKVESPEESIYCSVGSSGGPRSKST